VTETDRIFDSGKGTEKRPRYFNESSFDYYNLSARPGFVALRDLIERWYTDFPNDGKKDIRSRLRSNRETDFLSAFFELYLCQICRGSGFDVTIYPGMKQHERRRHPDFLVLRDGEPAFYLEGTLAQEPQQVTAAKRRLGQLEDAINRLHSPDFWLWLEVRGTATANIPVAKFAKRLQNWINSLDADRVTGDVKARGEAGFPTFPAEYGHLTFTITARPKAPDYRGTPNLRPLGAVLPDVLFECDAHDDIRLAVIRKAKRYGDLNLPYIVAINVINEFLDFDDILDGLFGRRTVEVRRGMEGAIHRRLVRAANGAWTAGTRPSNSIVSAALIANNLIPTTVGVETPLLMHNPWARSPFPTSFWRLPQRSVDNENGTILSHAGTQAREIIGIPEGWLNLE